MTALAVAALLLCSSVGSFDVGRGTTFSRRNDRHNHGRAACLSPRRLLLRSPAAARLYRRGAFVAHRTAPCWSPVEVCSLASGRCRLAVVADRGPRRAAIDLDRRLAADLGHDGRLVSIRWPIYQVTHARSR